MQISSFPFSKDGREMLLASETKAKDWPVVYLINNDRELYIGETQNAYNRFEQHLQNPERRDLKRISVIFDESYNKSAILDLEQNLIQLCGAEGKFRLQNHNGGQSFKHDYYQREKYLNKLGEIWKELKKKGLVDSDIEEIRNSDLFKYSPYSSLTAEQGEVISKIVLDASEKLSKGEEGTSIIEGGAGTGKTIVLINLLFRFISASTLKVSESEDDEDPSDYTRLLMAIQGLLKANEGKELKIAYVCPMTSLRETMKKVFRLTGNGLKENMVKGPQDLFDGGEKFDLVLVDEAHRLCQRKNITSYGSFDARARELGLDPKKATQLDFILARSKYRVLVYDSNQSVKGSDISEEQFKRSLSNSPLLHCRLLTQMRCKGGERFVDYLSSIFACKQEERLEFEQGAYEFKLFGDVEEMVQEIKREDRRWGLCRVAAGYSWEWVSKPYLDKGYSYIVSHGLQDIHIEGHDYVWNMTNKEFILSENAINEVGCIHTLQGYDLNYVGVILGEEIDYDPDKNEIVIDKGRFYDKKVKEGVDEDALKRYIVNSYKVMMSRGIKGCYVYACKANMRKYLERFLGE